MERLLIDFVKAISGADTPLRAHHFYDGRRDSTEPRRVTNDLEND